MKENNLITFLLALAVLAVLIVFLINEPWAGHPF
jgi:hypothetical protein